MQVNSSSSNSLSYINEHKKSADTSLNKISSGNNGQLDDTSLALIANAVGSNIAVLSQGIQNATDATSMMQIAGGVLNNLSSSANDLSTLSVASNNAALSSQDKAALNSQADGIKKSMQNSIDNATFNGQQIFGNNMQFSLGDSSVSANIGSLNTQGLDISSPQTISDFVKSLQELQSTVGATADSLNSSTNSILTQISSLSSAKSQMSDADIANEVNNFSQQNIMLNASMMAQAHQNSINSAMVSQLLG